MYYKLHIKSQLFIMNFDFQKAREMMVDNQLRPNKIKDHAISSTNSVKLVFFSFLDQGTINIKKMTEISLKKI